ncbi:MAG: pyridoxal-phosphate dependent enzyme, partial [Chloroflexota bacterium]
LGNVSALGAGFLMLREIGLITRLPRIAVAQAAAANPLYRSYRLGFEGGLTPVVAGNTQATAIRIGNPVSYPRAVRTLKQFNGVVEQATEDELAQAAARADLAGLFTDPHTGVALAVLEKLVTSQTIQPGERVIVISTANGLKFPEFKIHYHEGTLPEIRPLLVNRPVELPADYDAVREAVFAG